VSEGGLGIQVIDLSQVDSGSVTLVGNVMHNGHNTTHNIAANTASGYLYLCGANIGSGGLVAVSTANPNDPTIAGMWSGNYVHDAQVVTYTSGPYAGKEIAFCANGGAGLEVLDVTNKANMVRIGGTTYSQLAYCHQCWLTEDRQLLYVNDELDEQTYGGTTNTRILDVSDPANPVIVGTFTSGSTSIDHNLYTKGGKVYEANYRSGLRIFDNSNPTSPVQVGYFDTYPGSDAAQFNGAWSCWPYFPSGTIIISDIERGLFVVKYEVGSLAFQFPAPLPTAVTPNTATPVTVRVTEDQVTLDPGSVQLFSRSGTGAFGAVTMTPTSTPGEFTADLPAAACLSTVDYYFSASATDGRVFTSPGGAPGSFYSALSASGFTTVADVNFESDPGWAVTNTQITTGAWERAVPHIPPSSGCPGADYDGSGRCYVTDNRPDQGQNNFDVDGGPTVLTTGTFNLSGLASVRLSYARWINSVNGNTDSLVVQVSNNNGSTWTTLETVPSGSGWVRKEWDLGSSIALTSQMKVRFSVSDNPSDSVTEAGIDAFKIVSVQCAPPCYADCNGDGQLNLSDFGCFQTAFALGQAYADCNGDGVRNLSDFGCFQTKFALGCP
jgi:choice-of-anchor B domain-containing protein